MKPNKYWKDRAPMEPFVVWKMRCKQAPDLRRDKGGKFVDYLMHTQWSAYRQGWSDALPEEAPEHVLEAMIQSGARRDWVRDIYKAARSAVIAGGGEEA